MSFIDVKKLLSKNNLLGSTSTERGSAVTEKQTIVRADIEKVKAIDEKTVELVLKSNQLIETKNGFLIEVFLSGTDGKLTKLYKDSVEDLYGNITEIGFSEYLEIDLDTTTTLKIPRIPVRLQNLSNVNISNFRNNK